MTLFVPGIPIRSDSKMIKALKCCHKDRDPDRSHVHVQSQVWHFEKKKKRQTTDKYMAPRSAINSSTQD